jgi:hypothetical protein
MMKFQNMALWLLENVQKYLLTSKMLLICHKNAQNKLSTPGPRPFLLFFGLLEDQKNASEKKATIWAERLLRNII